MREDERASIVQSLARRVDWLVLLVVALYTVMLRAPGESSRLLYAAIAAYTLFVVAFRVARIPGAGHGLAQPRSSAAVMVAFITVVAMRTGGSASPIVRPLPVLPMRAWLPR